MTFSSHIWQNQCSFCGKVIPWSTVDWKPSPVITTGQLHIFKSIVWTFSSWWSIVLTSKYFGGFGKSIQNCFWKQVQNYDIYSTVAKTCIVDFMVLNKWFINFSAHNDPPGTSFSIHRIFVSTNFVDNVQMKTPFSSSRKFCIPSCIIEYTFLFSSSKILYYFYWSSLRQNELSKAFCEILSLLTITSEGGAIFYNLLLTSLKSLIRIFGPLI